MNTKGTHAIVSQHGGICKLVNIFDYYGRIEAEYSNESTKAQPSSEFGPRFVASGQGVLYGSVEGCVLVWDTVQGGLVYGLAHEDGEYVESSILNRPFMSSM